MFTFFLDFFIVYGNNFIEVANDEVMNTARKTRYFYVFGCFTMPTVSANLRMQLQRYGRIDIDGFNKVLETFSFD